MRFRARILCIDDNTNTCDWIRIVLRGAKVDAELVSVATGLKALKLLGEQKFDLCVVDYALPDMTGVQFCTRIKQLGWDVPVIFFTALNRPVDRQRRKAAGATEFLAKPDDLDIFADVVSNHLRKRRWMLAGMPISKTGHRVLSRAA